MIKLDDIKQALVKILAVKTEVKNIFSEDIEQIRNSSGVAFPFLHIQLLPLESSVDAGACRRNEVVLVDITYMEETKSSNATMYKIIEEVKKAIGVSVHIKERFLHVANIGTTIADDYLHITFQLKYNVGIEDCVEDRELFGEIKIDL